MGISARDKGADVMVDGVGMHEESSVPEELKYSFFVRVPVNEYTAGSYREFDVLWNKEIYDSYENKISWQCRARCWLVRNLPLVEKLCWLIDLEKEGMHVDHSDFFRNGVEVPLFKKLRISMEC